MLIEAIGAREQGRRFAYTERHLHKMERDVPISGAGHRAPGNRLRVNGASRQNRCAPCCAPALRPCRPLSQGSWALRSVTWTKNQFGVGDFSDFVPDFFLAYQSAGVQFVFRKAG